MKRLKHKYILLAFDWLVINASFVAAMKLQTRMAIDVFLPEPPFIDPEVMFFFGYSFVVLLIFGMNLLYKINIYLSVGPQILSILKGLGYSLLGIVLLSFTTKSRLVVDSRLATLYFSLFATTLLVAYRVFIFRTLFKFIVSRDMYRRTVLVVGAGKCGRQLASKLAKENPFGLWLIGFVDDEVPDGSAVLEGVYVLGKIKDVGAVVERHHIDEIVLCLDSLPEERYLDILNLCAKTKAMVLVASAEYGVIAERIYQETYGGVPVFGVMNAKPYFGQPVFKRVSDVLLALAGIIVLSPLLIVVAAAVKIDSRGPVLFKHIRIGKDGKPFMFYKFRSMYVGADADKKREEQLRRFIQEGAGVESGTTKIVDDSKITRVGRLIRRSSIDEMPQLFNVIKGDMSLIGPRPCLPYEWEKYSEWHKRRLSVTPGCTGVWQVFGRSEVSFRDMVVLDLFYAHNVSFRLDMLVLIKTIPVMLFGSGGK